MPIKGVSERRRLPRLGKIHLGIKALSQKSGVTYPKAVDYFVVAEDGNTPANMVEAFKKVFGEQPKALNVMFPTEDEAQFFQQWYKRYGQTKGLLCKGDGDTAMEVQQGGEMVEKKCPCVHLHGDPEKNVKKTCRMVANLQFLLPEVKGVGVWQIDTSSYNSIVNINSSISMVKALCGKVSGVPLSLVIQPQEAQVAGAKKIIYVLNLKLNESMISLLERQKKQQPGDVGLLPKADERPEDLFPNGEEEAEQTETEHLPADAEQEPEIPASAPRTPPPAQTAQNKTPPPAQKPASQQTEISLDDLDKPQEQLPPKPTIPICPKCKQPMIKKDGVINKTNPKTGKPYGFVKGWGCVTCKTYQLTE